MLKTATLLEKLNFNRLEVNNDEGGGGNNRVELAKKSEKLKSQNLAKFRKLSKSEKSKSEKSKKQLNSENSPNFVATETGPRFLTPDARIAFNRLWLAFIKTLIL